jgi:DNA repair protein SbcD/Mre11
MITFVHTADIHFGMENYGRIDPKTGIHSRLLDFVRALNFCIDVAIEKKVDLFLFCGDAYKSHHPTQMQQRLFFECLLRLYQAKIPVIIVVGNHDNPLSFGKAHALNLFEQLPFDGFFVFDKPGIHQVKTKNGPINIVGIPWPTRNTIALDSEYQAQSAAEITSYISAAVSKIIQSYATQIDPAVPAVLAAHLTVSAGVFSGSEKRAIYGTDPIFLPSQLAIDPFDYVALGHLHRFQNVNREGATPIIYSGSIERVDFGERKEDKGFVLVTVHAKGKLDYEFIKGPMRPFVQIEVMLVRELDHTQQIVDAIKKHAIADAVVKIIYFVGSEDKDRVNIQVVEKACSSAHYLVGIIPIVAPVVRMQRAGAVKVGLSMSEQLAHYFNLKPALKDKQESLVQKAMELLQLTIDEKEQ